MSFVGAKVQLNFHNLVIKTIYSCYFISFRYCVILKSVVTLQPRN